MTRKLHFAATEPMTENTSAEPLPQSPVQAESSVPEAVPEKAQAPAGESKAARKSQKRCVVCKRGTENCECKGGPLTREEYEEIMASRSGKPKSGKKKEADAKSVEQMARTLLFFYSKGFSWLSVIGARIPAKKADAIWAISADKCAEILPPSMKVLEKYWDSLPSWLTFIQEHMAEIMLGKALVEMTAANISEVIDLRRELRRASALPSAAVPKSKANGPEAETGTVM